MSPAHRRVAGAPVAASTRRRRPAHQRPNHAIASTRSVRVGIRGCRPVQGRGFTLIEALVVVAVLAIVAAIAFPSFTDYVRRSRIVEAVSALSDLRTRSEQYFLDHRSYLGACAAVTPVVQAQTKAFAIGCTDTATTYAGTASGVPSHGMGGFAYTIDHANARSSTITLPGWKGNATCWAIRKDGSCG